MAKNLRSVAIPLKWTILPYILGVCITSFIYFIIIIIILVKFLLLIAISVGLGQMPFSNLDLVVQLYVKIPFEGRLMD